MSNQHPHATKGKATALATLRADTLVQTTAADVMRRLDIQPYGLPRGVGELVRDAIACTVDELRRNHVLQPGGLLDAGTVAMAASNYHALERALGVEAAYKLVEQARTKLAPAPRGSWPNVRAAMNAGACAHCIEKRAKFDASKCHHDGLCSCANCDWECDQCHPP